VAPRHLLQPDHVVREEDQHGAIIGIGLPPSATVVTGFVSDAMRKIVSRSTGQPGDEFTPTNGRDLVDRSIAPDQRGCAS